MAQVSDKLKWMKNGILHAILHTTVEPLAFTFLFCSYLNFMVFQNFLHYKICHIKFGYNEAKCNNLSFQETDFIQSEMPKWQLYSNLALYIPSSLLLFFVGSWTDRFGFKIPMVAPCYGAILYSICLIINSEFLNLPLPLIILGDLVNGLSGGFIAFLASIYAYVSHISLKKRLIGHIGLLEAFTFIGGTVGQFVSGYLIRSMGYNYVFIFTLVLNSLMVFYILFYISDIRPAQVIDLSEKGTCARIFGGYHVRESFNICFKDRENSKRLYIILTLLCFLCIFTVVAGENSLTILYLKRGELQWDAVKYGKFRGIKFGLSTFMLLILFQFFHRKFQWQDTVFALIGSFSKIIGYMSMGFIKTDILMMTLVPIFSSFSLFASPSLRALISKLVESTEKGKVFALVSILDGLCSIFANIIFLNLYPLTKFFPGLCFEIFAILIIIPLVITGWMHCDMKKRSTNNLEYYVEECTRVCSTPPLLTSNEDSRGDTIEL